MSTLLEVRCAVCHVVAGEPCRTPGERPGPPLPYPHRGRDGTDVPASGTCKVGWTEFHGRTRSGPHACSRDHGQESREAYVAGGWALDPPSDHVCRCGDRFSHAAAVGMST